MIAFFLGSLLTIAGGVGYAAFVLFRRVDTANRLAIGKSVALSAIMATEEQARRLAQVDEHLTPQQRMDYAANRFRELSPHQLDAGAMTVLLEEASWQIRPDGFADAWLPKQEDRIGGDVVVN